MKHNVSCDPTSVLAKGHLNSSNNFRRLPECDRQRDRQTFHPYGEMCRNRQNCLRRKSNFRPKMSRNLTKCSDVVIVLFEIAESTAQQLSNIWSRRCSRHRMRPLPVPLSSQSVTCSLARRPVWWCSMTASLTPNSRSVYSIQKFLISTFTTPYNFSMLAVCLSVSYKRGFSLN